MWIVASSEHWDFIAVDLRWKQVFDPITTVAWFQLGQNDYGQYSCGINVLQNVHLFGHYTKSAHGEFKFIQRENR